MSLRTVVAMLAVAATLLAAVGARTQAQDVPVPQPRPTEAESTVPDIPVPQPRPDDAPAPQTATKSAEPSACVQRLTADIAMIETLPPVTGADGCGMDDPVRLSVVMTKDKRRLAINPPVVFGCLMAEALAHWLRDDIVDLAASLGAPLTGIASGQGYQCRGRNGIAGAPTSQHGRGNAMDLRALVLANGITANPTDMALPREFRERFKASACATFTTVLGPGSDGHHEIYMHMDVAPRRNGIRVCHWEVRDIAADIPLPRERPPEAPPR